MSDIDIKLPKTLAGCADLLFQLEGKRKVAQEKADEFEEQVKFVKNYLLENLPASDATGVAGKLGSVSIERSVVPTVKDWDKFYTYVKKNNAFDLLQKRLSNKAVEERWDVGKEVPGIDKFNLKKLKMSAFKVKK